MSDDMIARNSKEIGDLRQLREEDLRDRHKQMENLRKDMQQGFTNVYRRLDQMTKDLSDKIEHDTASDSDMANIREAHKELKTKVERHLELPHPAPKPGQGALEPATKGWARAVQNPTLIYGVLALAVIVMILVLIMYRDPLTTKEILEAVRQAQQGAE